MNRSPMPQVLTLIAKPLTDDHVRLANSLLPGNNHIDWLAEGSACDLYFDSSNCDITDNLRAALSEAPVDFHCQPAVGTRRKKLLLADMDSTIISAECIDEMADIFGLKERVAAVTERAMAGDIDFSTALLERTALLKGLSKLDLQSVFDSRIRLNEGARKLVATMTMNNAHTVLISGGFTFFTQQVAEAAGFNNHHANELIFANDRLTGEVAQPILGSRGKLTTLQTYSARLGLKAGDTLAVGDGANDLEMISAAGLGVAYHAKSLVAKAAAARIDYGDLTALLYLQGYRASQIRK